MLEKVGQVAGLIWTVLSDSEGMSVKELKKVTKVKTEKELYLGIGWLLREDKIQVTGDEKEPIFSLK